MTSRPPSFDALQDGSPSASTANLQVLFEDIYDELRGLARHMLHDGRRAVQVSPTTVVHEAYVRLQKQCEGSWSSEAHFKSAAAQAMRHVLIDRARAAKTQKRGGDWVRISLPAAVASDDAVPVDVVVLDSLLTQLANIDPVGCRVVLMRIFGDMTIQEIADCLDKSVRSIERSWRAGRAWMATQLRDA